MKIQRIDSKTGRDIFCNVPPLLPGEALDKVDKTALKYDIKVEKSFPLRWFLSRFMAGRHSLKESRQVSRKRLALIGSGVGFADPQANVLFDQIQRYNQAVDCWKRVFESKLDLAGLIECNERIAPEVKKSSRIRDKQNWVGGKNVLEAKYICPPPDLVGGLLENFVDYVNSSHDNHLITAYVAHCRLLSIHPFWDGNGRTSRAMFDGYFEYRYGDSINPLLYRLSPKCPRNGYVEAIELFNVGSADAILHSFWTDANDWIHQYAVQANELILQTHKKTTNMIGLKALGKPAQILLKHIWQQPIVCFAGLTPLFANKIEDVQIAVSELSQVGILQPRKLREPRNAVIYDCPAILGLYLQLDEIIAQV